MQFLKSRTPFAIQLSVHSCVSTHETWEGRRPQTLVLVALATKTKWRQPRVCHLVTGHALAQPRRARKGGRSAKHPLGGRPSPRSPPVLQLPLCGLWGHVETRRQGKESVVCSSVAGVVRGLTWGHQETEGVDVCCILTV